MKFKFAFLIWFLTIFLIGFSADGKEGERPRKAAEQWVFDFMASHAAPGRKLWMPKAQETKAEAIERYRDIAKDIVTVAFSPQTKPIFKNKNGRSMTITVWLGIMLHESGFRKDVDYNLGKYARGDAGQSWCMMQLMIGSGKTIKWNTKYNRPIKWNDNKDEIFHGYTGPQLIEDRTKCIIEGHKIARISIASTSYLPLNERLVVYASGISKYVYDPKKSEEENKKTQMSFEDGKKKSRIRMGTAFKYWFKTQHTRGFIDGEIIKTAPKNKKKSKVKLSDSLMANI